MRNATLALTSLALLIFACAPDSGSAPETPAPTPETEAIPIVPGTLTVRSPAALVTDEDGVESLVFELGCGMDGSLALAIWDRKGREEGSSTRAILGPSGRDVRAGERLTLRLEWRVRDGEEILRGFVRPIGGQEAVDALEAADPDFASARLAFVRLTTSNGGTGRVSKRFADDAVPPSSGSRTHALPLGEAVAEVPAGEEAVLFASAWVGPEGLARADAQGPGRITDGGNGFARGTETVDASQHPGPFWTLRVTLEASDR